MRYFLAYARASSDPDDQRISVDRQLKLCVAKGHELWPDAEARTFRDDDITAAKPGVVRPGFDAFLAAVRAAAPDELAGVIADAQSRLTRLGETGWDDLVVTFSLAGLTEVQTLKAGAVSVEPGNRLGGRIMAVIDAEEVERTKARTQAAHRVLFDEGRPSGRAPFGFRAVREAPDGGKARTRWEHDAEQAAVVRDVFAWTLDGLAISVIADKLNAMG